MNVGDLKINLLIKGVSVDKRLKGEFGNVPNRDLILPGSVLVSLLDIEDSPYALKRSGEKTFIVNGGEEIEVKLAPIPSFYKGFSSRNKRFSDIGRLYGRWLFIQLMDHSLDEVLETVEKAGKEGLEVIHLVPSEWGDDGGIRVLEPYIRRIKKGIDILLSVEINPPDEVRWIDFAYAMGVDMIVFNGIDLEKLSYAASIFPKGAVMSYLIPAYEPMGLIMERIKSLIEIGVIPLPLITRWLHPSIEEIRYILAFIYQSVRNKGINMGWIRNISVIPTPLDGRFFVDKGGNIIENFYRTRLGFKALKSLSGLIRRLRVKEIRDSFDSSGL